MQHTNLKRVVLVALSLVALFTLSGCGNIAETVLRKLFLDQDPMVVMEKKYWITNFGWWAVALVSMYLPLRDNETRKYTAIVGVVLAMIATIGIGWESLSFIAFVIIAAIFLVGGAILAAATAAIAKLWAVLSLMLKGAKTASEHVNKMAETKTEEKVFKAEEPFAKHAVMLVYGTGGGLVIVAILTGGPTYPEGFDAFLRVLGVLFAIVSFFILMRDLSRAYWFCPNCKETILDWLRNKKRCPRCRYFNPHLEWECISGSCKLRNDGDVLQCESCGTPRHGANKWLEEEDDE